MLSVLGTAYGDAPPRPEADRIEVSVVGLDEVATRVGNRPIDLLKIDAEGAEADILEGASADTLARIRSIVLEYHDDLVPDAKDRCLRVLRAANFHARSESLTATLGLIHAHAH